MPGNDSFAKLLLHCDGSDASTTFTDASPSARGNATVSGNAQVDTGQSKFGGASLLCDGSGDYLSYASSADWNFGAAGSGDFTIDFWVRWNSVSNTNLINAGNFAGTGWDFYYQSGTLRLYNGSESTLSWTPSSGTWYHIALVRNGGTITCYIDGTSIGTFTDLDMNNDSRDLQIAAAAGSFPLNGWMDEIRVSKGIARWTSNFTPPTEAYDVDGQPYVKRMGGVRFAARNQGVW